MKIQRPFPDCPARARSVRHTDAKRSMERGDLLCLNPQTQSVKKRNESKKNESSTVSQDWRT
jgi:hypothetical protein